MNPSLFSADGLVGLIFLLTIGITIGGGIIACNSERLVRAVAGLMICFIGVGALYYFLNSPFVAMMQVLIYVGAVAVTISFAIMLAAPEQWPARLHHCCASHRRSRPHRPQNHVGR